MGEPNQGAMEILSLLAHGLVIPENFAGFERQHSGDGAHQAGFAAAISTFEDQQFAAIHRKVEALKQAPLSSNQREVLG